MQEVLTSTAHQLLYKKKGKKELCGSSGSPEALKEEIAIGIVEM